MHASRGGTAPDDGLAVVPAADLDAHQAGALDAIYEQAFPPHLRIPLAELAASSPRDRFLTALDGGEPVGFAALRRLSAADWVFLRYYAVATQRRRSGVGLRFWRRVGPTLAAAGWPARIAFEVEDPADVPDDEAERQIRLSRIRFWESCGAVAQPVPGYVMPPLTDIGYAEPMVLMAAEPGQAGPLDNDALAQLVRAIYTEHYGLSVRDPLVGGALASIGQARA